MLPTREEILKTVTFKTSRSGGSGGQHINKVSSKVLLIFNLDDATYLNAEEQLLLRTRLEGRMDRMGLIQIVSQEDRSQLLNKEKAIVKLRELLKRSLQVQKKRKPTKVPKSVVLKRLKNKALQSEKKQGRRMQDF